MSQQKAIILPAEFNGFLKKLNFNIKDLVLYINSKCNLRCKHCYIGNELLNENFELNVSSIEPFISEIQEFDRITVIGGEPFLHSEANKVFKLIANTNTLEKRITTNLTVTKGIDFTLLKTANFRICVSLDSYKSETHNKIRGKGAFEKTIANIEKLVSDNQDVEITHTITSLNVDEFPNFVSYIKSKNIHRLNLHKISKQGNAETNDYLLVSPTRWRLLTEQIEKMALRSSIKTLAIRYPLAYVTEKEYDNLTSDKTYHQHASSSFYSDSDGQRIIIYVDGKVYISSEAFGTENYIGQIANGAFIYNDNPQNEIELYNRIKDSKDFLKSLNSVFEGDENYPISISVSFKRSVVV